MKFKVVRKINLSNIDKELWPYETEDLGAEDADSFDEAVKAVDGFVRERQGYYKAISDANKEKKMAAKSATPAPVAPGNQSTFIPASQPATTTPAPITPSTIPGDQPRTTHTGNVPADFQI